VAKMLWALVSALTEKINLTVKISKARGKSFTEV
jgi:hypothetical protein